MIIKSSQTKVEKLVARKKRAVTKKRNLQKQLRRQQVIIKVFDILSNRMYCVKLFKVQ